MSRVYYWVHHTAGYDGNTGVQRVVRGLAAGLLEAGYDLVPVAWCSEREAIVRAAPTLCRGFHRYGGVELPEVAQSDRPLHLTAADRDHLDGGLFLLPEVSHIAAEEAPSVAVILDYARYHGLRSAAIFYDLIPLRFPGYEAMQPGHEAYAKALLGCDVVIPISRSAGDDLTAWWTEQGYGASQMPPVRPALLPHEIPGRSRGDIGPEPRLEPIRFLAIGTVEPRKNQVALLEAFARLRRRRPDLDIELDLVGGVHAAVAQRVSELTYGEPRIRVHRFLDDARCQELMRHCHASVFVSLAEGYGLPIAESLWQGRPCLCSNFGSMAEIAQGGGCLPVDSRDSREIERGIELLATDPSLRARLAKEARARPLASWRDYAQAVLSIAKCSPPTRTVTVIHGARGLALDLEAELGAAGVKVFRLLWRPSIRALLPGNGTKADGAGRLAGQWAILPWSTVKSIGEHEAILAEAHGLGLRVMSHAKGADPHDASTVAAVAKADVVLFAEHAAHALALTTARRTLPVTTNLDRCLIVGTPLEGLAAQRPAIAAGGTPRRPSRIYLWVGLTITQPFNTGIQRVARALATALDRSGVEIVLVKWDPSNDAMVPVSAADARQFARWGGPTFEPPKTLPTPRLDDWLLLPEVTLPMIPPGSNVARVARRYGLRSAALFYDIIPEKQSEYYSMAALEQFREFSAIFAEVDIALPISWTVAFDLRRHLRGRGMRVPEIVPCPLAGEIPGTRRHRQAASVPVGDEPLRLLAVGTWEPRKNYLRVLRALAEARRSSRRAIHLVIIGRRAGFLELDAEVERLAAEIGDVDLRDHVSDAEMIELYSASHTTIFASWEEGFGLPVLESLWRGVPCLRHEGSSLIEVAAGGGTIGIDMQDERAIAEALARLADSPDILVRLGEETVSRRIKTWDEYAQDVVRALADAAASSSWPLPMIARQRPLLTCAITTYNRAPWLRHSLARLLEATRPWRDVVEVVVCDNASTDETPDVVRKFADQPGFVTRRNPVNVGMLGNLGATARASRGAFVWLLGDDDLIVDHAIEDVLEGLAANPDVEMAYMNYGYTRFDDPARLADAEAVIREAVPIAEGGPNRRVDRLREIAGINENLFTAIYACAFRRDHALRAYQQDTTGPPFSSLLTCVPSSVYALRALADRPAWWVGEPAVVVNMNVSWLRWALLWHLERMPDLYDMAEWAGVDSKALDRYRWNHCQQAAMWARMAYFEAEDAIREGFSMQRLLQRCKHLEQFRATQLPKLREVYAEAWAAGRVTADQLPPVRLFAAYGLDA